MKITKRITGVLLAVAMALPITVRAQGNELSLDDCIELALKNRASIIAAIGNEQAAKAGKTAALGAFLPRISASYSYSKSKTSDIKYEGQTRDLLGVDTYSIDATDTAGNPVVLEVSEPQYSESYIATFTSPDQDGTNKNLSFSANMSLFNLANIFNYASASSEAAAARLSVLSSEQDLIYSVKLAYFSYLANFENISVQEEAVKRAEEQLKLIESRFELGSASKSDVLKQKVQYGNDRLALLSARNAVTNSKATLAYTVGIDPRQDWNFATNTISRTYEGTLDEAVTFGLENKPSLLAMDERFGAARSDLRAARSLYLPTLSGYASLNFSDGTRGDTVVFDQSSRSRSIGFQANWNIFDGFSRERQISLAKVAVNNRRAEIADARNLAVSDIKTAYLEIEQLREQKSVSQENVDAAEEDLKITQEKYNLGAATILDLLDAQVSLKEAQVSLIRAEFDLNLAIAKLENAMGKM